MPDTLLHTVSALARLTGDVAMRHFRRNVAVERKQDGSPVTIADREAEQAAREWIARHFPDDGILGEEFGEQRAASRRRWLVDPIDGTRSFVRGVPLWGTLVAVCEGETTLAGAAYFPAANEFVAAERGVGCWWNGVRAAVSGTAALSEATVLTTDERFAGMPERRDGWHALAASACIGRTWGDAYGHLLVATGRADVMVDPIVNAWDLAPFIVIVEEAGGVFTDWSGRRTAFGGSAIATNTELARTARELLGAGAPA